MYVEPVKLIGEGRYNLNDVKEIKVTDAYLNMDSEERRCQNEEEMDKCTSRQYRDKILNQCACLPLRILDNDQVNRLVNSSRNHII